MSIDPDPLRLKLLKVAIKAMALNNNPDRNPYETIYLANEMEKYYNGTHHVQQVKND